MRCSSPGANTWRKLVQTPVYVSNRQYPKAALLIFDLSIISRIDFPRKHFAEVFQVMNRLPGIKMHSALFRNEHLHPKANVPGRFAHAAAFGMLDLRDTFLVSDLHSQNRSIAGDPGNACKKSRLLRRLYGVLS